MRDAIQFAHSIPIGSMELQQAHKAINENIFDKNWSRIFREALVQEGSNLSWKINIEAMYKETKLYKPNIAGWAQNCGGLWPGRTLALFAAHSRWVHLSTNTLPFYNVMPRLQECFPQDINIHASNMEGPETHWMHNHPEGEPKNLNQRIARFLKWQDGTHVLLEDKSEAGWLYIQDRSNAEHIPEHVHHNYLYTDMYEQSRKHRGVEGAGHGVFKPSTEMHKEDKW